MKGYRKETVMTAVNMAWPAVVESFFVAFAGLLDSLMVSSLGASYVAAVGLTTQPKFIGFALFIALNVSVSALVARRRGQQDREAANRIMSTALTIILIGGTVMSMIFVGFADPIIALCGSTPETHDFAVQYFRIIMGGMIFNCISMSVNSAQRGAGNTRITMRTNITSNTLNVIGNYLLIGGHFGFPALGIQGAAIATVFGTMVASIMSILSITKKDGFISLPYIFQKKIKPSFLALKNIFKVGYSVFLEQILMRIGFMATALMAANQGTEAMAAHQVGMNILSLSFAFGDGLQSTAVALIGRSLGEKDEELAKEYGKTCQMLGTVISVILAVIYFFGAGGMMRMFFKEPEIVDIGIGIMRVSVLVVIFQVRQVIYMGCLRGAGDTSYTAMVSTISVTIVRTAVSYFCGYILNWGIIGIWFGIMGDQISRFVMGMLRFKAGKWTKIKI